MNQHAIDAEYIAMNGRILFEGPSLIGEGRIVAIAIGFGRKSKNAKTGDMIQVYILPADVDPLTAIQLNQNSGACGRCAFMGVGQGLGRTDGRICYVNVGQAPLSLWRAYQRGAYGPMIAEDWRRLADRSVRIGAYGDPAALPVPLVRRLARSARNWTGYSNQLFWIDQKRARAISAYLMASCSTKAQLAEAHRRGWRAFLTVPKGYRGNIPDCVQCPHYTRGVSCTDCNLCNGTESKAKSVYVVAHAMTGSNHRWRGIR